MYIQPVRAHGAGTSDQPGTSAVMPNVHELRLKWGRFLLHPTRQRGAGAFKVPLPFVNDMETTLEEKDAALG